MTFLDQYYGLKNRPKSNLCLWRKYHKLTKVEYFSFAELGAKLVQLCRELLYRYHTQSYLDGPNWTIEAYGINFEWDNIGVLVRTKNFATVVNLKAV